MSAIRRFAAWIAIAAVLLCAAGFATVAQSEEPTVTGSTPTLVIPPWEVLYLSMTPPSWKLIVDGTDAYRAAIEINPEPIRTLRYLVELMASTGYIDDPNGVGLHTFFSMQTGALAPEIVRSLRHAGFTHRADVFQQAIELFGPAYPVDNKRRGRSFAYHFLDPTEPTTLDVQAPPTPVDLKLRELGPIFGTNADLKRDITAYVASHPTLITELNQRRDALDPSTRFDFLARQLLVRLDGFAEPDAIERHLATLLQPHRTAVLLALFMGEINNGGMHQFFSNSSGAYAPHVVVELRSLGLDKEADAVAKGLAMFPKPYLVSTTPRRVAHFQRDWNEWDDRLSDLTDDVDIAAIAARVIDFADREQILPR